MFNHKDFVESYVLLEVESFSTEGVLGTIGSDDYGFFISGLSIDVVQLELLVSSYNAMTGNDYSSDEIISSIETDDNDDIFSDYLDWFFNRGGNNTDLVSLINYYNSFVNENNEIGLPDDIYQLPMTHLNEVIRAYTYEDSINQEVFTHE